MTDTRSPEVAETPLSRDILFALRYYLGGRRGVIALAAVGLVAGLALNWSWLVTAGMAPLLLTALPCLVMCAFGLCMNRMAGRSCSTETAAAKVPETTAVELTTPVSLAELPAASERQAAAPAQFTAASLEPQPASSERSTHDA